jgi:hypothetical protein
MAEIWPTYTLGQQDISEHLHWRTLALANTCISEHNAFTATQKRCPKKKNELNCLKSKEIDFMIDVILTLSISLKLVRNEDKL